MCVRGIKKTITPLSRKYPSLLVLYLLPAKPKSSSHSQPTDVSYAEVQERNLCLRHIASSSVSLSLTKPGGLFRNEIEHQYFSFWITEFLQLKCSTTYLAAFESDLWSRLIPQVSFEEEFAKHAVIALGAMNKAAEASEVLAHRRSVESSVADIKFVTGC